MNKFVINGGNPLNGKVYIQGAKNAVLPIMAGSILASNPVCLENCPSLNDVFVAGEILRQLGCEVVYKNNSVFINPENICKHTIPCELMSKMRSSVMFLGAVISRFKKAVITQPGGCDLGRRPIDIHLKALRKLGVEIEEEQGIIVCFCDKIKPCTIQLEFPSVGATENIILATCISDGITVIENSAREPEIEDLQNFLNRMGGDIKGAGTSRIVINGVKKLKGVNYRIMPDRIVTATYLSAVALCGGEIEISGVIPEHVKTLTDIFENSGCRIGTYRDRIILKSSKRLKSAELIETGVFPGFPTDAQPLVTACMTCAEGKSHIKENIFTDRFRFAGELAKMGADITVIGTGAFINGVENLRGAEVDAMELRGGAALVIAGLKAQGETKISNIEYIDRGYENIEKVITNLGGNIRRVIDEKKQCF